MRRFQWIVQTVTLGLLLGSWAGAQDQRIVTSTNLVGVNVIVTDKGGRYIRGLTRDDFEVFDEKVKQQIAHFSAEPAPVSLAIVCEIHYTPSDKTSAMLAALRQFTRNLRHDDDFFFMAFGPQGSVTTEFIPAQGQVLDHLTAVKPGGPSSLYDAVYSAADRLRRARNLKKALLIVSDGEDDNSRTSYKALRNRLREFDVQIYAVGIANPVTDRASGFGRWLFEDITRQTPRRPFLVNADPLMGQAVLAEMARVSGGSSYILRLETNPNWLVSARRSLLNCASSTPLRFTQRTSIQARAGTESGLPLIRRVADAACPCHTGKVIDQSVGKGMKPSASSARNDDHRPVQISARTVCDPQLPQLVS